MTQSTLIVIFFCFIFTVIVAEPSVGAMSISFEENVFPGRRFYAPTALYNKLLDELQFCKFSPFFFHAHMTRNL